jgi:hypothetical protein
MVMQTVSSEAYVAIARAQHEERLAPFADSPADRNTPHKRTRSHERDCSDPHSASTSSVWSHSQFEDRLVVDPFSYGRPSAASNFVQARQQPPACNIDSPAQPQPPQQQQQQQLRGPGPQSRLASGSGWETGTSRNSSLSRTFHENAPTLGLSPERIILTDSIQGLPQFQRNLSADNSRFRESPESLGAHRNSAPVQGTVQQQGKSRSRVRAHAWTSPLCQPPACSPTAGASMSI